MICKQGWEVARLFEEIGTHPENNVLAVAEALTFHQMIGAKRKEARLVHLQDSWAKLLLEHDRVRLHTSLELGRACGIATVEIEGIEPADLFRYLWVDHRIRTTPITHDEIRGIRVSPSVYTTLEDRLLHSYLQENPGDMYLEFPVGGGDENHGPRRIDGVLVPGPETTGWSEAVDGQLYGSIRKRKTHQNMGNLFGWIYGDQPAGFREHTWERYKEHATEDAPEMKEE